MTNQERSQTLQLKHQVCIQNVLYWLSQGDSLTAALANSGVSSSAWHEWKARGYIDNYITQLADQLQVEFAATASDKWRSIVGLLLDDCADEDAKVSDRDRARRTLGQWLRLMNFLPTESDSSTRGEPAREWLARHSFPPVTVLVQGDLVGTKVATNDDNDIVEGEAYERPNYSPRQVHFPIVDNG